MSTISSGWKKFKNWKTKRPFWGATLTLISGAMILWVPMQLYEMALTPGSMVFVGFFLGGLVFLLGFMSYIMPRFSTLFGVISIFASVLSIMGALGGLLIGTILGIVGGSLCVAWKPQFATAELQSGFSGQNHFDA
ncbi:DUF6114 domain-containing protein [Anoxybacteroides tepidamans]|uniref:DUF6114 domain-containing protein n=1 Tax=Anoxybacteroides tepidamans TaxID=265948 RepID=UPI0004841F9F|nr:DUF6114 domain-containing protein [Anoxybacillus tepidamans]